MGTTGAAGTTRQAYPRIDSVTIGQSAADADQRTAAAGATSAGVTSVPKDPTLVMNFTHSMDTGSILDSRLRLTDVTGGDDRPGTHSANYSFELDIRTAAEATPALITPHWPTTTPGGAAATPANSRLELTFGSYQGKKKRKKEKE